MNPTDSCLQRLFRAAARRPEPISAEVPFPLEARILAAWGRGAPTSAEAELLPVMRAASICACAIILITAALGWQSLRETPPNELMIVDSVIRSNLMQ